MFAEIYKIIRLLFQCKNYLMHDTKLAEVMMRLQAMFVKGREDHGILDVDVTH